MEKSSSELAQLDGSSTEMMAAFERLEKWRADGPGEWRLISPSGSVNQWEVQLRGLHAVVRYEGVALLATVAEAIRSFGSWRRRRDG